jgi:hypothetical protein
MKVMNMQTIIEDSNEEAHQLLKKYPYDEKLKKLKKLPKDFIKQYIYDTIKKIFPHVLRQIDKKTQKWIMTVIAKNREQIDSIEQQFELQINSQFNTYISKRLGNPKEYNRLTIKFFSEAKGNIYKIETF